MKNTLFLTLFISLLGHFELKATHLMGGDITYQNVSSGVYKITFKIYRDCRGIVLNDPSITMFCESNPGNAFALNFTRTSIKEITPICSSDTNSYCFPVNTSGAGNGYEEHVFEATVNFNSGLLKQMKDAGCCKFKIQMSQCCRNLSLTTLNPGNFYVDAMMDICNIEKSNIKSNTSPLLMNLPVLKACCNKPLKYNYGAIETEDGDSLSYELVAPLSSNNSDETYTGNFNARLPMTPYCPPNLGVTNCRPLPNSNPPRGFYFDMVTGNVVFTPSKCDEVGIIALQVNEWRKDTGSNQWKLIGYIKREMQVIVYSCDTTSMPPSIDNSNDIYDICEGDSLVFDIKVKDLNSSDTLEMDVFHNIPNTSYQVIENTSSDKIIRVSVNSTFGDGRLAPYTFAVNAKDNSCPFILKTSQGFSFKIRPKPTVGRKYLERDSQLVFEATRNNSSSYNWTIKNEKDSIIKQSTDKLDSCVIEKDKYYYLKIEFKDDIGCENVFYDTLIFKSQTSSSLNLKSANNQIKIYPNPSNGVIKIEGVKQSTKISVFDISGKELMIHDHLLLKSNALIQLQLPKGMYLLKFEDKDFTVTKKVTIY
jgi:hypothetical protein